MEIENMILKKIRDNVMWWFIGIFNILILISVFYVNKNGGYFILDVPSDMWYAKNAKIKNLFFINNERFMPWLFMVDIFVGNFMGEIPVAIMTVQMMFFVIIEIVVIRMALAYKNNDLSACFICGFLFLASPFVELFYSVGKAEMYFCCFICIWWYAFMKAYTVGKYFLYGFLCFVSLFCLLLTKETSLVMCLPLLILFVYDCWKSKLKKGICCIYIGCLFEIICYLTPLYNFLKKITHKALSHV